MKNYLLFILTASVVCTSGCTGILKAWYGIRDPQFETHESIMRFQEELGYDDIPYLGVGFGSWENGTILHTPDMFVFDSAGRYIPYRDSLKLNCNGPAGDFLSQLDAHRSYVVSGQYSLGSFLGLMESPGCAPVPDIKRAETDFYVFITIAKYGGKRIVREKTDEWIRSLRANRSVRYRLFFVNQDPKGCWTAQQKQRLEGK